MGPLGAQDDTRLRDRRWTGVVAKPRRADEVSALTTSEVAALATACGRQGDVVVLLAYTGLRFGELVGLWVEDVDLKARRIRVRRSITQVGGKLLEGNPKSAAGWRSIPLPQRVMPILTERVAGLSPGAPAITSPTGALLGLENWKRATRWRAAIVEIGRPSMRVHDLRHTYASLARRAGADLRLLQKTMGHASITVTAHIYADLYDDELDVVASALDSLDDCPSDKPEVLALHTEVWP